MAIDRFCEGSTEISRSLFFFIPMESISVFYLSINSNVLSKRLRKTRVLNRVTGSYIHHRARDNGSSLFIPRCRVRTLSYPAILYTIVLFTNIVFVIYIYLLFSTLPLVALYSRLSYGGITFTNFFLPAICNSLPHFNRYYLLSTLSSAAVTGCISSG